MVLRKVRWMTACLLALVAIGAAPSRSNADVQILVQELDASGNVLASQSTPFSGSGVTPTFNGVFFTGFGSVTTNSGSPSSVASLVPAFNGQLTSAFDVTQGHMLRLTVTDNNFKPNGPAGSLKVEVAGTTGFATGSESVVEETRIFDPATNTTIALYPMLASPDGTKVTDTVPVSGLTMPYAIQQTLTISFNGEIPANATFGSTGGASLTSNAVPAPGGLVLALIGLPLLGARRALRRWGAAATATAA
ncbi:MAG: hypothetical protein J0I06_01775 [Planctomycetes bacterium]|nr:hypothetical protein [Planctomycetota bacterium]